MRETRTYLTDLFRTLTVVDTFRPFTQPSLKVGGGEENNQDCSSFWFKAAPGSCPVTGNLNGLKGAQMGWSNICVHHRIQDFSGGNRGQDKERWTLCLYYWRLLI